jgi:hypothetical protein
MKKRQMKYALGMFALATVLLTACGNKGTKQADTTDVQQGSRTDAGTSKSKGIKGASDELHMDELIKMYDFSDEVMYGFKEISETEYPWKDQSNQKEGDYISLESGPITAEIPATQFSFIEGAEFPTANFVTENRDPRYAFVSLVTSPVMDTGTEDATEVSMRIYQLATELQTLSKMDEVEGIKAEVINIDGFKWLRISCKRLSQKDKEKEQKETIRYITYLANRKVELRFTYFITTEESEGRTESPFTEDLMREIVGSVATIPVEQYKKPKGLRDLDKMVDTEHIQSNSEPGIEEVEMISIGAGEDGKEKYLKLLKDYVNKSVDKASKQGNWKVSDKSAFKGEGEQLLIGQNKQFTITLPAQYYADLLNVDGYDFTKITNVFKNKADLNPESYIEFEYRNYRDIADVGEFFQEVHTDGQVEFVEGFGFREDLQAGIQIHGDKLFFVTIELGSEGEPYGKTIIKRAFSLHYPYFLIVSFIDYGEKMEPLTQGEIEVLKSISYNPPDDELNLQRK